MFQAVLYFALCVSFATAQDPYWPCPEPNGFLPCVCTAEGGDSEVMDVDCSAAENDDALLTSFQIPMSFYTYRNLKIIGSGGNNFNRFTMDTFGGASFETIEITGTSLQVIEDGTLFRSEEGLTSLILSNNAIRTFPFESLSGFTALDTLLLNDNSLTTVQKITSPSLVTLSLSDNPNLDISLGLFEVAGELQTLGISRCNLTDFTEDMFTPLVKLITLDLSGNKFEELETSSIHLPENTLQRLDLSNNPLAYVETGAISGLSYPAVSLVFASTQLVELAETSWNDYFTKIEDGGIDLTGTPLRCGCDIAWLFTTDNLYVKLTPTTQCSDGTDVQRLEKCVFEMHCDIPDSGDCVSLE